MISGHISNPNCMYLPKDLRTALDYLRYTDLNAKEAGTYKIMDDKIICQVLDLKTKEKELCPLESHRRYIDIQYLAKGCERIYFAHDTGEYHIQKSMLPERDIIFYESVEHEGFIDMTVGTYAIFFPYDIHRPAVQVDAKSSEIRKIVIKVDINLLNEVV